MCRFYSHAVEEDNVRVGTKLLKYHLKEVGESIREKIPGVSGYTPHLLSDIGYLIGISHDFGKYTTFFQDYLLNKKESGSKHWHSFISALFTAYLVNEYIKEREEISQFFTLISFFVVLHHHGDLGAIEDYIIPRLERKLKETGFISIEPSLRSKLKDLEYQVEDVKEHLVEVEKDYEELLSDVFPFLQSKSIGIKPFFISYLPLFSFICRLSYQLLEKENEAERLKLFAVLLIFYSTLIDADKREAAEIDKIKRRKGVPDDLVDRYRENSPEIDVSADVGINGIRNEIYRSVTAKICDVSLDKHIFTLIAPTGTGKTLTSFSAALKLRKRLTDIRNSPPRIIYSLPFTSIIDQNYEELRKVLSLLPDFSKDENVYLTKHHHLADIKYKVEGTEEPIDEALFLIESWEAEVIITTFIQLLHTIIGFKNRFLKKYHNIAGSIIILDEVQNIPIEYWPLVNKMFKLLTDKLGCYIILLTATKPLIFEEDEVVSLLDDSEKYFKHKDMNRVTLIPSHQKLTLEDLFSKFSDIYNERNSYLIVFNTIASSIRFYKMLKENDRFSSLIKKKKAFYLSTNIIPKERSARIKEISRRLARKEKIVIVSTQVIEAGIDIDVDIVMRDVGPFDSIVQVAGRCNREMKRSEGKVYVFHLTDGRSSYAQYVYGSVHPAVTLKLFDEKVVKESHFFDLINHYFMILKEKKNQDISNKIWKAVEEFRFHRQNKLPECISDFELINEKSGYVDVFVETEQKAIKIWKEYITKVIKEKDFRKRQNNYLSIRRDLNSYLISIPQRLSAGLGEFRNANLYYIPNAQLKLYYDNDTGFKRTEEGVILF